MSKKEYTLTQTNAIKWNEGPVLVLAGPGSGKTAVLTERIGRLIRESENENFKILALTFTNKAASEMSERILKITPKVDGRLFIGTFHSFCAEVLRNHGSNVNVKPNFTIYSRNDDLNSIINDLKYEYKALHKDDIVDKLKLLTAVQYFQKLLCISESDLDNNMPKTQYSGIFKWFYLEYHKKMSDLNVLDFNSLVLLTYKLFKENPNIAKIYRKVFKYICIDEFQDTNFAQYELIRCLVKDKNKNIFIVADDDQVIYGWNGASYQRINQFKNDYGAEVIQLFQNFRCPDTVVSCANKLIKYNSRRTENKKPIQPMKKGNEIDEHIQVIKFKEFYDEINWIINKIINIRKIDEDSTICIIGRNNKLVEKAYEALIKNDISAAKSKRKDEFETPYIVWLHTALKLANKRNDEKYLTQLVNTFNLIASKDLEIEKILLLGKTYDGDLLRSFLEYLKTCKLTDKIEKSLEYDLCEGRNFKNFIDNAFEWLDSLVEETKFTFEIQNQNEFIAEYLAEKEVWQNISNNMKYNYDSDEITLAIFLQEFEMFSKEKEPSKEDVQCLTIHASKGKEFDYVFLIGLVEDELPSFQSKKNGDDSVELEEERRNCFVAITRTINKLIITYSENYFGWDKKPSRFIAEMLH